MLANQWKRGVTVKHIAFELDRSIGEVKMRRLRLGLPTRKAGDKNRGLRLNVSDRLYNAIVRRALDRQQPVADYLRSLILRDIG